MPLPMKIDDITPRWLTAALGERFPGTVVRSSRIGTTKGGAASKIQVYLDYAAMPVALPATMVLKMCVSEGPMGLMEAGLYHREAFFYRHIRDRYDIRVPQYYYADGQHNPDQAVILLEDLTQIDARFGSARQPYTPDEVASGLEGLAEVHARSMIDTRLSEIGLPMAMDDSTVIFDNMIRDADMLFGVPRGFSVPVVLHDKAKLAAGLERYRAMVRTVPNCIVHGDTHIGNTYRDSEGIVYWLDWQMAGRGHWLHDVIYFMGSALDVPDRRSDERRLLRHYREIVIANGAPMPDDEEIWRLYRGAIFYGFITWLGTEAAYQPEDICTACLSRFGAAMIDLDSYAALGV